MGGLGQPPGGRRGLLSAPGGPQGQGRRQPCPFAVSSFPLSPCSEGGAGGSPTEVVRPPQLHQRGQRGDPGLGSEGKEASREMEGVSGPLGSIRAAPRGWRDQGPGPLATGMSRYGEPGSQSRPCCPAAREAGWEAPACPSPRPGGHSLACTCRQHLEQTISGLVPSSPTPELAGRASGFSLLQVKHSSGMSGRVLRRLPAGGAAEGPSPREAGGASFSVCRACG